MDGFTKFVKECRAANPELDAMYDAGYEEFKVGAMIKMARKEAGLTQDQLAEKLHTKKSSISRLENHAENVKLSTLERAAEALGMRLKLNFVKA